MKILKIQSSPHVKGRILLFLEDGTLLKMTEKECLTFDLHPGAELDKDTLEQIRAEGERSQWRQQGAAMTGRRMFSGKEVCDRLMKKGAGEDQARETVEWLQELGAVDDAGYAGAIVRHYAAAGYGAAKVRQELQRRGVPRELWEVALAQMPPAEEAIRRFAAKRMGTGQGQAYQKTAEALLRRGFRWDEIRPVLREWEPEMKEEL